MRALTMAALCAALCCCDEPSPCDGSPGTCLNVDLQDPAGAGTRIDGARLAAEGDRGLRVEHEYIPRVSGLLLPVTVALPLPADASGNLYIEAQAVREGQALLRGCRTVADLVPGSRRLIWIELLPPGAVNDPRDRCRPAMASSTSRPLAQEGR